MKKFKQFLTHSTSVIALCLLTINHQLHAAPGIIENSPLFLTNRAEPNIFFMLDNSGSMQAEMMTPEGITGWGGIMRITDGASRDYRFLFDSSNSNSRILPTQARMTALYGTGSNSVEGVWRGRNNDYNGLYYDPTRTYRPWTGYDSAGNEYTDIDVSAPVNAPVDPYLPAGATYRLDADNTVTTDDLSGNNLAFTYYPARYWLWDDSIANGNVDHNDTHTLIEIKPGTPTCTNGLNATKTEQLNNACMLRSYTAEMQNFANWFSYHRSRELTAKYAMSQVIGNSTNVRMGVAVLNENNNNDQAQRELASMDNLYTGTNKRNLLDGMGRIVSSGSTPLRIALMRAGNYFDCRGTRPDFNGNDTGCGIQTTPAAAPPGACQQNFTVLMSDGERNNDDHFFTQNNVDGNNQNMIPSVGTGINSTFSGYAPYADNVNRTLADVAMSYYATDLDSSLPNNVSTICGVDENDAQHMVTYTVGFGVTGNLDLSTIPAHPRRISNCTLTPQTGSNFVWSTSDTDGDDLTSLEKIDDMVHAAFNGRGEYLSAQDPEALSDSLNNTLRSIASRTGAASAVAINASSLSTNSVAYFAKFNSATWEGEFWGYPIDADGNIGATPIWGPTGNEVGAHKLLENKSASERAIVTYNPSADTGIAFRDFANLTTAQQDDLKTTTAGILDTMGTAATDAQARLDYLRGDHSCESSSAATCSATGKLFRDRILNAATFPNPERYKLGDIIHSSPVYVGAPPLALPNRDPFGVLGERYHDFKYGLASASDAFTSGNNASTRTPMIYVGANDGMLHAFNALTGEEIWAYVPDSLFATGNNDGLHKLTETDYEHKYYVDLDPTVVDAFVDTGSGTDWHTVLVGGLRAGGRGLFAIDVTDPDEIIDASPTPVGSSSPREDMLASRVMWEFSDKDDIDMGLSYSKPQIVPLGDKNMSTPIEWYVIFGNGYNSQNTATGANPYSSKLFILKLSGPGADGDWDLGTDYWKIDTAYPAGTDDGGSPAVAYTENNRNGMSTPAVADSDGDGIGDRVYAGDLLGRLWAFNVSGEIQSDWDIYRDGSSNPIPLLIATDGDSGAGNPQPITSKPSLAFNTAIATDLDTTTGNFPNLMVYVGTGSYLTQPDLNNTATQSFYGVWDSGESHAGHTVDRSSSASSHLVQQTISTDTVSGGDTVRTIQPPVGVAYTSDFTTTDFGWFMDLPDTGERVIVNPTTIAGITFFNTVIPSTDACGFGGTSWSMFVDALTGQATTQSLIDFDLNGTIGSGDETSGGNVAVGTSENRIIFNSTTATTDAPTGGPGLSCPEGFRKYIEIITLSDGTTSTRSKCLPNGAKLGRTSWRELNF